VARAAGEVELPARRVVLVGASNLTRGISTVVESARLRWGRPLDLLAALGHGRSYGLPSRVLGRTLPPIVECGLWPALAARRPAPTAALVTDIGNDLFYGASVDQVFEWVERCLDHLAACQAKTVLARLPRCNFDRVGPEQFRLMCAVLFPRFRGSLGELVGRAVELDERLCRLARQRGCAMVEPRGAWYGFDPIHIKLRHWPAAWNEMFAPWSSEEPPLARGSMARWLYLRSCMPADRRLFGVALHSPQPCGRLRDGTRISFY
ncbi:MAG TPA: hypothetical protein VGX78_03810, partial [Pirellulales bacterium]|nr:hypothetical protein [Pirellulales bacterium]